MPTAIYLCVMQSALLLYCAKRYRLQIICRLLYCSIIPSTTDYKAGYVILPGTAAGLRRGCLLVRILQTNYQSGRVSGFQDRNTILLFYQLVLESKVLRVIIQKGVFSISSQAAFQQHAITDLVSSLQALLPRSLLLYLNNYLCRALSVVQTLLNS